MTKGDRTPSWRLLHTALSLTVPGETCTMHSEAPRAVCSTPEIEVEEGDAVILPCHLDPSISLSAFTVDWKRVDVNKVVYSYRRGQKNPHDQMETYRHRTGINHEDLSRGNMTLLISSVQLSDSGRYKCFVPKLVSSCIVNLTVVPKDQHYRTKTDGFTTAKCPHEEPDNPGGKTINIVLGVVICLVGVVVGFVVGVLIGIRCTKIQKAETSQQPIARVSGTMMVLLPEGWETTSSDGRMEAF
ncbi:Myelin-oligodendrocyte glycoprotein Precursor [Channa argus]|uniref:Myelin-oligodendrocyte glycoprotein n=1 Tax=Channa argus TaxID=215402 RepID=A0A6G1PD74_CHAAH|nr:Myelin-oligodendrocyte glycoprotein Precursor [Channa argus]